ncbi:MATE family efflux transporter [Weeksellaceae bacterium TAE3-ERU29]|nr:MATE family efflux transporter [Weeksellaceae bacterium TAE3-ERU29]
MLAKKISFKEINRLAIPAIIAGIVEPLISLTDTVVAGHIPSDTDEVLGAVGIVGSFISAMIWMFAQTSNAIGSLVAQGVGQNRINRLRSLVSQLFFFNLGVSFLMSLLAFSLSSFLFRLYGAEGSLLEICLRYFHIRVWGFPFTLLTFTLFGVFRGYQNTSWGMIISVIGGITNVVLDLLFVFYFHWDVEGIAWASLIAQALMFLIALVFLFKKTPFRLMRLFPLHTDFLKTLVMSFDLFLRSLSLQITFFFAFRTATGLGETEQNQFVAAHTLLVQIWLFSAFLLDGYSNAGAVLSGKLLGAKQFSTLRQLTKDLLKITFSIGLILAAVYFIFYYPIGEFLTKSTNILPVFYASFWIVILMQPINSIAFLYDGIYKGMGRTQVLRNILLLATFIGFLPSLYLFQQFDLKLQGIWYAFFIWIILRTIPLIWDFHRFVKRNTI